MLPVGNINNLFYPMTADIYYPSKSQNDFGEFDSTWYMDRTINCSAIRENPSSAMRSAIQTEKFSEYDIKINLRTSENIFKSVDGTHYQVTDILITNIKDPLGSLAWMESDIKATNFEIENVEPYFDESHNVSGYRVLLRRSDWQVDV